MPQNILTMAWHVLGMLMEETASRCGEYLLIYWISSYGQQTKGGPPSWE
jgi:hypothetical protein